MPLNINEFKAAVHKYDLERPNLFSVDIAIPSFLRSYKNFPEIISKTENGKLLSLYCKNANLPGVNVVTANALRYGIGPTTKIPISGTLNDVSLTFLNDSNSFVYSFFYLWVNAIYPQAQLQGSVPGSGGSYILPFKKNYQTEISVSVYHGKPGQFGGGGLLQTIASVASAAAGVPFLGSLLGSRSLPDVPLVKVKECKLYKIYPLNISDISLSSSATDTVSEFTVNFAYQSFDMKLFSG